MESSKDITLFFNFSPHCWILFHDLLSHKCVCVCVWYYSILCKVCEINIFGFKNGILWGFFILGRRITYYEKKNYDPVFEISKR